MSKYTYSEYMSERFITQYLEPYLAKKVKNGRTAREYAGYLRILCNSLSKDFLNITELDATNIMCTWISKMKDGKLSRKTICVRLSCYNSICRYIMEIDENYINPFKDIGRPHVTDCISPANIPSMKEMDQIMTAAHDDRMYYLIIALVTRACISATKITQLTLNSIIRDEDKLALCFNSNNKNTQYEVVTIPEDVIPLFNTYIETISSFDDKGHLFYNQWGNALTIKNLDSAIARFVEAAGLNNKYTLKDLRTRGILELINAGVDESTIMKYTGLGSMRTRQFAEAKGLIAECPANLVNYRLCTTN